MVSTLRDMGISVSDPSGAFYIFLDFAAFREKLQEKGITNSRDMCRALLNDTGIAVLPGSVFGRDLSELTARLSFVDFDGAKALADAEHISSDKKLTGEFLTTHFSHTMEAMDKLRSWLR